MAWGQEKGGEEEALPIEPVVEGSARFCRLGKETEEGDRARGMKEL